MEVYKLHKTTVLYTQSLGTTRVRDAPSKYTRFCASANVAVVRPQKMLLCTRHPHTNYLLKNVLHEAIVTIWARQVMDPRPLRLDLHEVLSWTRARRGIWGVRLVLEITRHCVAVLGMQKRRRRINS